MKVVRLISAGALCFLLLLAGFSFLYAKGKAGNAGHGKELYKNCKACHGAKGQGNKALGAPALAGQESWYVIQQLKAFKAGIRGAHTNDTYGQLMRPMSLILKNEAEMRDLAAYVATFQVRARRRTGLTGNVAEGKKYYKGCATCHGTNAKGNQTMNAPGLANLEDWYLLRQMNNYKKGIRGTHAKDKKGKIMKPIAEALANKQALVDTIVYIKSLQGSKDGDYYAGKRLYARCETCHGVQGEGNKEIGGPALAGQEPWYIAKQVNNFKKGIRGTHAKDVYGQLMRSSSHLIESPQQLKDLLAYIKTLPVRPSPPSLKGDATLGPKLYSVCATCHGQKAEGNKSLGAPMLSGQQDWYLLRQIQNFKKGLRGVHAKDKQGKIMRPMAQLLSSRKDMLNIIAYIKSFKKAYKGNPTRGKRFYKFCKNCHGADGNGDKLLESPGLAGQQGWYMLQQLRNFKKGIRGTNRKDKYGMMMQPMALFLRTERDMHDVIAYIGTLEPTPTTTKFKGSLTQGQKLYAVCSACHGPKAQGIKAQGAPALTSLEDWYLLRQLELFKQGIRGSHAKDKKGQTMKPMAQVLNSKQAMIDVIIYIKSLKKK